MLDMLWQDMRQAARSLRRTPAFTAAAILTLALGIGANTAIFSVVNGVVLRPLPYGSPDRLVHVYHANAERGVRLGRFSPQDYDDLRAQRNLFDRVASYFFVAEQSGVNLVGAGEPVHVSAAYVSEDFFPTLQVGAALGRTFDPGENVAGADRVVVLSDAIWRRQFGADPSVVGRAVNLGNAPHVVIGVMPRTFQFPAKGAEIWLPVSQMGEGNIPHRRNLRWLGVVARLRPDAGIAPVEAATTALLARLERQYPDSNQGWNAAVILPLHEALVGDVRPALLVVLGAVGLVLLIAAGNLAGLLLARATVKSREVAIRAALGATRARVASQFVAEGLLLAVAGGGGALTLARLSLEAITGLAATWIPRPSEVQVDVTVVAFTLAISLGVGLLVGVLPAFRAGRGNVQGALRASTPGVTPSSRYRFARGTLVVAETAMAVVLVVAAGLMLRTVWQLLHVDTGFRAGNVLTLQVPISSKYAGPVRVGAYRDEMVRRVEAVPGVIAVGASKTVPLMGGGEPYTFALPGSAQARVEPRSGTFMVTPGYFDALGIRLLAGRTFDDRDAPGRPATLVVNESMARQYWPGDTAVGKRLLLGQGSFEVIGLVADVRHDGLTASDAAAVYVPHAYFPRANVHLFVRTSADPLTMVSAVVSAVRALDPEQAIADIATMDQVVARTISQPRLLLWLLGAFAAVALLLAAIGLYGVISYVVGQRRQEIGVRIALGARRADVVRMVVLDGMTLAGIGLAIGLAGALATSRALSGQLFGVTATDASTFVTVAMVLGATALVACLAPAARAARVDPMSALRSE